MKDKNSKKIIIFGLLGIGDIVEFSPCFRLLKEKFPDSTITLFTIWESIQNLFKESPFIDEIICEKILECNTIQKFKILQKLRKKKFDISILPFPSYRREFNIVSFWTGAKNRYSFDFGKGKWSEINFLNNHLVLVDKTKHNVENNFKLLDKLGIKTTGKEEYELPIHITNLFLEKFLKENNIHKSDLIIGIHPGSDKRGKDRRISISKFARISDHISKKYKAKIILFFGPHEKELKQEFIDLAKNNHIIVDDKIINEVAKIISSCSIFISSDSGLMHIASAMKIPTVVMYGPTDPVLTHPWQVPYEIVTYGAECSPCFYYTEKHALNEPLIECKIEDKFSCVKEIQVSEILFKIDKLIELIKS